MLSTFRLPFPPLTQAGLLALGALGSLLFRGELPSFWHLPLPAFHGPGCIMHPALGEALALSRGVTHAASSLPSAFSVACHSSVPWTTRSPSFLSRLRSPRLHCFLFAHFGHFEIVIVTFLDTFLRRISKARLVSPGLFSDFTSPWLLVPFELSKGICSSHLPVRSYVVALERLFHFDHLSFCLPVLERQT